MKLRVLLGLGLSATLAAPVVAGVTIADPTAAYSVGIDDSGALYDGATGVGFLRQSDGYDPILPKIPRDSWSVFTGGRTYDADPNFLYRNEGITTHTAVATAGGAATITDLSDGSGTVTQTLGFIAPNVLRIEVTVTNLGTPSDFRYRRDVDWDIDPTEQQEIVDVPSGAPANVEETSYYGFEDPTAPFTATGTGTHGPGDYGGGITVDLGTLGTGASATVGFYYAISALGQSPADLRSELDALGVGYSIVGYASDGDLGTSSHSAALGLAAPVPEPASFGVLVLGAALAVRRRPLR